MHGKILRYSSKTKSGVIQNASKKIFELREEAWHDPKTMPQTGMLVEFRCDEGSYRIVDCHSSKFQEFDEKSIVQETDFWKTETDAQMQDKIIDAKGLIARDIFAQTNYQNLTYIEESISVQESVQNYFKDQFNALKVLEQEESENRVLINYLITKDYLTKAIDYLIFADKGISPDAFHDDLQLIKRLEYGYREVVQNEKAPIDKIYMEYFLEEQYHFKGVQKAISTFKETRLQQHNKMRVGTMEIRNIQAKIAAKKGDIKELEERAKRILAVVKKAEESLTDIDQSIKRLTLLANEFQEKNLKVYGVVFKKIRDILLARIKKGMDIAATNLDDKIWQLGMASEILTQTFFKPNVNGAFCSMTFLYHNIKLLNLEKVSENAKQVALYYYAYKKKYARNFLVFSENEQFIYEMKVKILSSGKTYMVKPCQKEVELLQAMDKQNFDCCFIDSDLKLKTANEILHSAKSLKKDGVNTEFQIIEQRNIKDIELL